VLHLMLLAVDVQLEGLRSTVGLDFEVAIEWLGVDSKVAHVAGGKLSVNVQQLLSMSLGVGHQGDLRQGFVFEDGLVNNGNSTGGSVFDLCGLDSLASVSGNKGVHVLGSDLNHASGNVGLDFNETVDWLGVQLDERLAALHNLGIDLTNLSAIAFGLRLKLEVSVGLVEQLRVVDKLTRSVFEGQLGGPHIGHWVGLNVAVQGVGVESDVGSGNPGKSGVDLEQIASSVSSGRGKNNLSSGFEGTFGVVNKAVVVSDNVNLDGLHVGHGVGFEFHVPWLSVQPEVGLSDSANVGVQVKDGVSRLLVDRLDGQAFQWLVLGFRSVGQVVGVNLDLEGLDGGERLEFQVSVPSVSAHLDVGQASSDSRVKIKDGVSGLLGDRLDFQHLSGFEAGLRLVGPSLTVQLNIEGLLSLAGVSFDVQVPWLSVKSEVGLSARSESGVKVHELLASALGRGDDGQGLSGLECNLGFVGDLVSLGVQCPFGGLNGSASVASNLSVVGRNGDLQLTDPRAGVDLTVHVQGLGLNENVGLSGLQVKGRVDRVDLSAASFAGGHEGRSSSGFVGDLRLVLVTTLGGKLKLGGLHGSASVGVQVGGDLLGFDLDEAALVLGLGFEDTTEGISSKVQE